MAAIEGGVPGVITLAESVSLLRIALFCGLVAHKGVWEAMKARDRRPGGHAPPIMGPRRRLFKAAKALALVCLAMQTLFFDILPMQAATNAVAVLGVALYTAGLILAIAGRVKLGRNWSNVEDAGVLPAQTLVTDGIYRYVRHPIYAGDAMLLVGLELALESWLVVFMVFPLLVFAKRALAEEALLAQAFPDYSAYCKRSKRFLPFVI
jgi:protein-S-isoprenylcysteine O-methyltransferase Ste14